MAIFASATEMDDIRAGDVIRRHLIIVVSSNDRSITICTRIMNEGRTVRQCEEIHRKEVSK